MEKSPTIIWDIVIFNPSFRQIIIFLEIILCNFIVSHFITLYIYITIILHQWLVFHKISNLRWELGWKDLVSWVPNAIIRGPDGHLRAEKPSLVLYNVYVYIHNGYFIMADIYTYIYYYICIIIYIYVISCIYIYIVKYYITGVYIYIYVILSYHTYQIILYNIIYIIILYYIILYYIILYYIKLYYII